MMQMEEKEKAGMGEVLFRIIPLFVITVLFSAAGIIMFRGLVTPEKIGSVVLQSAFAGFSEEFVFRFLFLGLLLKFRGEEKHIRYIFITSVVFGLAHLLNLIGGKFEIYVIMLQIVGASIGGVIFGFMYYHVRKYWLNALVHTVYDFGCFTVGLGIGELAVAGTIDLISELLIMVMCVLVASSFMVKKERYHYFTAAAGCVLAVIITVLKVIAYT